MAISPNMAALRALTPFSGSTPAWASLPLYCTIFPTKPEEGAPTTDERTLGEQ